MERSCRISIFTAVWAMASVLLPVAGVAAEPPEPLTIVIEAVDVPAREILSDGVNYSLSGRATVTMSGGSRLKLEDLKPGMRVDLWPVRPDSDIVNSVVLQTD